MRFFGPMHKDVQKGGEKYISRARVLLGIVAQRMKLNGLKQLSQTQRFADGTVITAGWVFGLPFVRILAPRVPPQEEVEATWFLCGIELSGSGNNAIWGLFLYAPEFREFRHIFDFANAGYAWAIDVEDPIQGLWELGYWNRIIDIAVFDGSVGALGATPDNEGWRGYGRFDRDEDSYVVRSTTDSPGSFSSHFDLSDGDLPHNVALATLPSAELRDEFGPAEGFKSGETEDLQHRVFNVAVDYDTPTERAHFLYCATRDDSRVRFASFLHLNPSSNVWTCPMSYEHSRFKTAVVLYQSYGFCPRPLSDDTYVYYLLSRYLQFSGAVNSSTPDFFVWNRAQPYDDNGVPADSTFEHRILYKCNLSSGTITEVKRYTDTAYFERDESENGIVTAFGITTRFPCCFLRDTSFASVGFVETETETYDSGLVYPAEVGLYNDKLYVYAGPAQDLLNSADVVVRTGGIENAELILTIDLPSLFPHLSSGGRNDAGTYQDYSNGPEEDVTSAVAFISDFWILEGQWTVNENDEVVDECVYGMILRYRINSAPGDSPGAFLRYSVAEGLEVVYDNSRVNSLTWHEWESILGDWVLGERGTFENFAPAVGSFSREFYCVNMRTGEEFSIMNDPVRGAAVGTISTGDFEPNYLTIHSLEKRPFVPAFIGSFGER